jgi:hypothetical protein
MKATTVINIASSDLLMKASPAASADRTTPHAFPVCDAVEGNPKADESAAQMNCHLSPSQTLAHSDPSGNCHANRNNGIVRTAS